jgi:hypothetical protein
VSFPFKVKLANKYSKNHIYYFFFRGSTANKSARAKNEF